MIEFFEERSKTKDYRWHLPDSTIIFVVRHDDQLVMAGALVPGAGFADLDDKVHVSLEMRVFKYSHNIFKAMRDDWKTLLQFLKQKGFKKLIVLPGAGWTDDKFRRFVFNFGFHAITRRPWPLGGGRYYERDIL
jgi:hypothetical protein